MDRRRIETPDAPPSTGFRSQGLVAADYLFVSGMIGSAYAQGRDNRAPAPTLGEQVDLALGHLRAVTRAGGGATDRVVDVSAFVVPTDGEPTVRDRIPAFLGRIPPLLNVTPVSDVATHGLVELDWVVSLDPTVTLDTAAAPLRALGHGAGTRASGPFIAINDLTAPGRTMAEQTRALFEVADEQLRDVGSGLDRLVKLSVFIADFERYPEFNDTTKSLFAAFTPPARSVVVAPARVNGAMLRVDLLALADSGMQ